MSKVLLNGREIDFEAAVILMDLKEVKKMYLITGHEELTSKQQELFDELLEDGKIPASDIDWFIADAPYEILTAAGFTPRIPAAGCWVSWSGGKIYIDAYGDCVGTAEEVIESLVNKCEIAELTEYNQQLIDADELLQILGRVH